MNIKRGREYKNIISGIIAAFAVVLLFAVLNTERVFAADVYVSTVSELKTALTKTGSRIDG